MANEPCDASGTPPARPPLPIVRKPPTQHVTPPSVRKHFEHLKPLCVDKIRWFYYDEKTWIPFNGADSIEIENTFRTLPEALQSPLQTPTDVDLNKIKLTTVRGQLYEVDVLLRECRPIYWKEAAVSIRRGTWFKGAASDRWEPLDEKHALRVEEGHIQVIRSMGLGASDSQEGISPGPQNVIHQVKLGINRVDWHDIGDVYITSESTGSRLVQKIGLNRPTPLHRGYNEDAVVTDRMSEINHIVFLVHGMGQLYHGDGGIVHSRKKFVEAIDKGKRKFFKEVDDKNSRLEFFPIEWRSKLKLDEGMISRITPDHIDSVRRVINSTMLDVFYYTSPYYRHEIIQAMRHKLNSVYRLYCERNPSFVKNGGKVSIIAHSLGSVIIHDVLTLWNSYLAGKDKENSDVYVASGTGQRASWFWRLGKPEECTLESSAPNQAEEDLKKELHEARLNISRIEAKLAGNELTVEGSDDIYSLDFKVENVFNIGSPLGVFLVMRGTQPRNDVEQHILPESVCKRTFNVYDPADPVAYRLEPVIYDYYASIPPVRLAHVGSTLEAKDLTSDGGGWFKTFFGSKATASSKQAVDYQGNSNVNLPKSQHEVSEKLLEGKKVLKNRIDYVLEQSMVQIFSAITSHQAYWHNLDFAKFVLQVFLWKEQDHSADPSVVGDLDGDELIAELEKRSSNSKVKR